MQLVNAYRGIPSIIRSKSMRNTINNVNSRSISSSSSLNMGFFDFLTGPKASASASHILIKGNLSIISYLFILLL
jgi:hypothetical protein